MRKALVPFLVLGLLLLGVSPAMAAGEQAKAALPAQQDEVVQVVVPSGEELDEVSLSQDKGAGPELYYVLRSAAMGALTSAGMYVASQKLQGKRVDPKVVVAKAVFGAGTGIINGTLGVAKKTIEYGGKVARYTYNALKWTFNAAFKAAGYLWNRGTSKNH